MIFTALDNFYITADDLANSPSRKDGVSQEVERDQRIYGCEFIQEGCILLALPQAVTATGQVLLHRFYCKVSLKEHDIKVGQAPGMIYTRVNFTNTDILGCLCLQKAAMACTWLATKLEEAPRVIKQILSVFYRLDRRRQGKSLPPLDTSSMVSITNHVHFATYLLLLTKLICHCSCLKS